MATSTVITDYIAFGTHAARPVTPSIPAGATSIYYETDTTNTFVWSGSAWVQVNGGSGPTFPTVVQRNVVSLAALSTGITLGAAPTNGNMLVAIMMNSATFTTPALNAGWTLMSGGLYSYITSNTTNIYGVSSFDTCCVAFKTAGAGESATQTPSSEAQKGSIAMWELTAGAVLGFPTANSNNAASNATLTTAYSKAVAGQLTLGACCTSDGVAPSSTAGMSNVQNAAIAGTAVTAFDQVETVAGTSSVSTTNTATVYKVLFVLPFY